MTESSRSNPKQLAYFHKAADLVGIFGVFHQKLVADKAVPFAYRNGLNPEVLPNSDPYSTPVITAYAENAKRSLATSWLQLLQLQECAEKGLEVPTNYLRYTHPFIQNVIRSAYDLGKDGGSVIGIDKAESNITQIFLGAFTNSTEIMSQLCALFGDEFDPNFPVLMSRVALEHNHRTKTMIGLPDKFGPEDAISHSYDLVHPTEYLNRSLLRSFGRGTAIGCPASMPVTEETRKFIEEFLGINLGKETMLKRYGRAFKLDFDRQVRLPFLNTPDENKDQLYTHQTTLLLSGLIWQRIKSQGSMNDL